MGNPFDQFDDKSQNPFDKFDAKPSFSDYAIDAARTIPGGLAQGAAAVAGLPGDVEEILNRFGDKVTGITPEQRNVSRQYGLVPSLPTSAGINKVLSAPTGGYYQAKYTPGEYAQTVAEFVPGYVALNWYAIAGPRGLPPPIVERLAGTLAALRDLPEIKARFVAAGTVPLLTGPGDLSALLASDVPKWQRVVAEAGIRGE